MAVIVCFWQKWQLFLFLLLQSDKIDLHRLAAAGLRFEAFRRLKESFHLFKEFAAVAALKHLNHEITSNNKGFFRINDDFFNKL
jgi:hypothetical protein